MGNAAPIFRGRGVLQADHLSLAKDVPQPEIHPEPAIGLSDRLAGDEALVLDRAPVAESRRHIDVAHLLDERRRIERSEKTRAIKIGAHHLSDVVSRGPTSYEVGY